MEIESLVTRAVLTLKADDTMRDAAIAMMERGVGSAVVMADGRPSGIVTDREALRVIARGVDASVARVAEYTPKQLATVTPSMEVVEAARVMREKNYRHLVVVDEQGELFGVFSMRDLVVGLLRERASLVEGSATAG